MQKPTCLVESHKKGRCLVVKLIGRLDVITAPDVEAVVFNKIQEGEVAILLNLEELDYLSSSGLRTLLSVSRKLDALSGKLVVFGLKGMVKEVFTISGLDHHFVLCENEEEGRRLLDSSP